MRHLRARSFVSSEMWKPSASTEPTLLLIMAISSMDYCILWTELKVLIVDLGTEWRIDY